MGFESNKLVEKSCKTLIYNDKHYLAAFVFGGLENEYVDVKSIPPKPEDKNELNVVKMLWKILFKRRVLPYFSILYSMFIRKISSKKDEYDELLIVAIEDLSDLTPVIKKHATIKKLFFWQWNPKPSGRLKSIDFTIRMYLLKFCGFKIATFDKHDSINHNISYHPQIYSKKITEKFLVDEVISARKALFIGKNKGRAKKLNEIAIFLNDIGIEADFRVVQDTNPITDNLYPNISLLFNPIVYQDYLGLLTNIEFIVEINQNGQVGLTLRALESIFFNKKLITDNKSILNYDFYNSCNIFVIDFDADFLIMKDEITKFISTPYQVVSEEVLNRYDVNSLVKHFRSL